MQDASGFANPPASIVKRLFLIQENLVLLGGSALFALAFASPIPLMLGAACELLWLALGSGSPNVRRWAERRGASKLTAVAETTAPQPPAQTLSPEYARRVIALDRALAAVRTFGGARPQPSFDGAMARLATLRPVYVGFCETHERIGRFLAGTTESLLVAETERLKNQFAAEKDLGTRLTLRQAIGASERHIEHRRSMAELQRSIGVKLESVERSLAYLVSQGLALVANPALPEEVEALLNEVGPALDVKVEGPASVPPSSSG